ncbi:MAG TPA: DUF2939 domain-containing protein [Allosphingosinicella sp.]|nr:DUF2939 domain-containing protein [Allosphingosinicella sp.]
MRRGRLVGAIAAAVLVAAPAAWYFGSPWWTLWRMREAARAGDMARLAAYVDMDSIRAQAKREFETLWSSVLADVRTDSPNGRDLVELARRKLADPSASVGLRAWLASVPIRFAGLGGGGDPDHRPYIVRRGLDAFEVREERASLENGPVLTFRRHGLGWKLSEVRLGQP